VVRGLTNGLGCGSTEFFVLRSNGQILPEYLYLFLRQPSFRKKAKEAMTGAVGQARVPKQFILETKIPVPPLNEQRRIVARIEGMMERIRRVRNAIMTIVESIDDWKRSYYARLFFGYQHWPMATLGEVCHIEMGQSPPGDSCNTEGRGILLVGGASDFGADYPKPRQWTTEPTKVCQPGDLILSIRATIGRTNVADRPYCIGRGVAALRPKGVELEWLRNYLMYAESNLVALGTGTTFLQVTKRNLEQFLIPLPPRDEQRRIISHIKVMREQIRRLEEILKKTSIQVSNLEETILLKAFSKGI